MVVCDVMRKEAPCVKTDFKILYICIVHVCVRQVETTCVIRNIGAIKTCQTPILMNIEQGLNNY